MDLYCGNCGVALPPSGASTPKSRTSLLAGAALTAIVGLVLFVYTQHQAIIAEGRASEAAHQRWLQ